MILYEVSLFIDKHIYHEFKIWLNEHATEMLSYDGFIDAKILSETSDETSDERALIVQYILDSEENLNNYFNNKAMMMRKKGTDLFGEKFRATRRILKIEFMCCSQKIIA
ncbi:MAG: hypothetical protein A3F11_01365 [Gammaproteobacteria bacterium RIFCSPHIGHO2_12_FULL_37_14]|nr:MAG: hypothetical protein A3F11_01365 [Gammaproteobacteria bacterium RIFCSPHIGHO2_12_FULL_37_14]